MTKMYLFFYFVNIYVKHVEDRDFCLVLFNHRHKQQLD